MNKSLKHRLKNHEKRKKIITAGVKTQAGTTRPRVGKMKNNENVLPAAARSTFLKTGAKQNAFKNVSFEPLLAALALSIPLRRALFRH